MLEEIRDVTNTSSRENQIRKFIYGLAIEIVQLQHGSNRKASKKTTSKALDIMRAIDMGTDRERIWQ